VVPRPVEIAPQNRSKLGERSQRGNRTRTIRPPTPIGLAGHDAETCDRIVSGYPFSRGGRICVLKG